MAFRISNITWDLTVPQDDYLPDTIVLMDYSVVGPDALESFRANREKYRSDITRYLSTFYGHTVTDFTIDEVDNCRYSSYKLVDGGNSDVR